VLHVQNSALGYVLAEANGQVVYRYSQDTKGGKPTCTGSCAQIWLPVTGSPVPSAADHGLGTLSTVSDANGARQITYNGYPLYTFAGAKPFSTAGNGLGGVWHVIPLSATDIGA
jgi:predicted lipoprotein with Yx(FWY)xxD motif